MVVILISQIPVNVIAYEKEVNSYKANERTVTITVTSNAKTFYLPDDQQKYLSSFTSQGA